MCLKWLLLSCAGLVVVLTCRTRHSRNIDWDYLAVRLACHPEGMQPNLWVIRHHYRGIIGTQDHRHSRVTEVWRLACITSNTSILTDSNCCAFLPKFVGTVSFKRIPFPETIWIPNTTRLLLCMNNSVGQLKLRSRMCQSFWSLMSQTMWLEACEAAWLQTDSQDKHTKSDQFQISPAASPEILHPTVWRMGPFIAYSDERWIYYQYSHYLTVYILCLKG